MMTPKIAIVDTGMSSCKGLLDIIPFGISVNQIKGSNDCFFELDNYEDYSGHGTAIAIMLSNLCPNAVLIPVRISQVHDNQCISHVPECILAHGIDWCIKQNIRLINVSYSIESLSENGILVEVCQKAKEKDVIIVAAYRNNTNQPVYPASFPNVIGASILENSEYGQISIVSERNHDVAVFGGPYQVTSINNEIKIVCGTSFAAAQVTGMVGRMLAIRPTLTFQETFRYLKKYSI
jgi:hypothetical protein